MTRLMVPILLLLVGCGGDGGGSEAEAPFDEALLGRWDVTVTNGEIYPLWFEIVEQGGRLTGRLQGRFGHALPLDEVAASGDTLTMKLGETTYRGRLEDGALEGEGEPSEGEPFPWTAVRAPELRPPVHAAWDEPLELFNGEDLTGWVSRHPSQPNRWTAEDGVLVNEGTGTDLMTEDEFFDFRLEIDVNVPEGSNSGIYLRGRYEVQVQDDYGKEPHSRHMGGIYGQVTPTVNAARPAGEWQSFEIMLLGRVVTVVLNGTTVIDREEIPGITGGALDSDEAEPGPILLQGDHGRILYRNIVLTPRVER